VIKGVDSMAVNSAIETFLTRTARLEGRRRWPGTPDKPRDMCR